MSSDSARAGSDEPDVDDRDATEATEYSESSGSSEVADQDDAVAVEDDEDDEDDEAGDDSERRGLLPRRLVLGSAALALAAFIVAAVFGILWLATASGDRADLACSRDAVLDAARDAVPAVTELDYKNPDSFFKRSKAASTDEFGNQLTKAEKSLRQALAKAKTSVSTEVLDVAVQELNDHEGTATFLAVIKTDISQDKRDATKVLRLKGQMQRISGDEQTWKLSGLSEVPVVGGGAKGQNPGNGANGQGQQGAGQGAQQQSGQDSDSG